LATFYCACAEKAISELPAAILITSLDSATPISYMPGISRQSKYVFCSFSYFAAINLPYFYFRSTRPSLVKSGSHVPLQKGIISTKFEAEWTIRYRVMKLFLPIRYDYIVTLTINLLTLNGCREFLVTCSNVPPNLSILGRLVLELSCSQSDH